MSIVFLIVASMLILTWFIFLNCATQDDWGVAAYNKVIDNTLEIEKLRIKDKENLNKIESCEGIEAVIMKLLITTDSSKKISKIEENNEELKKGILKSLNIFVMPGYVIYRKFNTLLNGDLYRVILNKNIILFGKKYAVNKTKQLIARVISILLLGLGSAFTIGGVYYASNQYKQALTTVIGGTLMVLFVSYALYDEIQDNINKREKAIKRQFPNMVSKLALLVTSGMIVERAWNETAFSENSQLYIEMQKTSDELDNLVSPEIAYGGFIDRCNVKEVTKLASAITQNLSKGNAEIGRLLKDMAKEAWLERRHMAKRDSESASAKLLIPTLLLFLAILVMIIVPIAMNFSSM